MTSGDCSFIGGTKTGNVLGYRISANAGWATEVDFEVSATSADLNPDQLNVTASATDVYGNALQPHVTSTQYVSPGTFWVPVEITVPLCGLLSVSFNDYTVGDSGLGAPNGEGSATGNVYDAPQRPPQPCTPQPGYACELSGSSVSPTPFSWGIEPAVRVTPAPTPAPTPTPFCYSDPHGVRHCT